jgi:hypothetical protein
VTAPGEDALRRGARSALGGAADPLAREALEEAVLSIDRDVTFWEGTMGTVRGHRVALALEARLLARVLGAPGTQDALHAAFAAAMARAPGEALSELRFLWSPRRAEASSPYRGRIPSGEGPAVPLREAMVAYLEASGEAELAGIVGRASLSASAHGGHALLTVRLVEGDGRRLAQVPSLAERLAACGRALLASAAERAPEVRIAR